MFGSPFKSTGLTGSSGKIFPKRMLLQYFLSMLKVCILCIGKHHAAFSLGTQAGAQLTNTHFLMGRSMGQNYSSHYLINFINRAVRLKHILESMSKYVYSFFRWSRLKKPIYKCILKFLNRNFRGFKTELLTLKNCSLASL